MHRNASPGRRGQTLAPKSVIGGMPRKTGKNGLFRAERRVDRERNGGKGGELPTGIVKMR